MIERNEWIAGLTLFRMCERAVAARTIGVGARAVNQGGTARVFSRPWVEFAAVHAVHCTGSRTEEGSFFVR